MDISRIIIDSFKHPNMMLSHSSSLFVFLTSRSDSSSLCLFAGNFFSRRLNKCFVGRQPLSLGLLFPRIRCVFLPTLFVRISSTPEAHQPDNTSGVGGGPSVCTRQQT